MNESADRFVKSRRMTRLGGIFMMVVTGAMIFYIISTPQSPPRLYIVLPFFFMLGLGIALFPISKAESFYLYGTTKMPFKHMPLGLKICIVIGAILSAGLLVL